VIAGRFSMMFYNESIPGSSYCRFGMKSTYKHSHILNIHDSYVKICESSCCFLAVFLICSPCECLLYNALTVRLWY
jgi:hypothetical protein